MKVRKTNILWSRIKSSLLLCNCSSFP